MTAATELWSARGAAARRRRFWLTALALVALGLGLRLAVSAQLAAAYPPVRRPAPATDMYTYETLARQFLDGQAELTRGFYYQPFYYTVWLPLVRAVGGSGPWPLILGQTLLAGASIWLTALAFARLFGRAAGLWGAGLLAVDRCHVFYTPFALLEVLQGCWLSLLLYLAVRAFTRRRWWWWAGVGLVAGLATCTRGNVVLLLPAVLWLAFRAGRGRPLARRLLPLALVALAFYLPQLPYAWVNYRATGRWVGTSTAAGAVLALGNTPEAPPGGREPGSAGPMCYPESYAVWLAQATAPDPAARVSVARNLWRWCWAEPWAWLELKFRTLLLFWNRLELPNNVSLVENDRPVPSTVLRLPVLVDFWLVGGLGLAGLGLALRRARRRPLVLAAAALALLFCGAVVLFYMLARFRLPGVPWLCGFAGVTVVWLWRAGRRWRDQSRRRGLRWGAAGILLSLALVGFGYDVYRFGWEAPVLRLVRPHGVRLAWPEQQVVKDHGPYPFGGWVPLDLDGLEVRKTFVWQPPPPAGWRLRLRLGLVTRGPTQVGVTLLGADGQTPAVTRELTVTPQAERQSPETWLELELPPGSYVSTADGRLTVACRLAARGGAAAMVLLDTQRDYGRTRLNVPAPRGELVAELRAAR